MMLGHTVYDAVLAVALTDMFLNGKRIFIFSVTAVAGVSGLLCAWCISNDSEEHFRRYYPAHVTYSSSTVLLVSRHPCTCAAISITSRT